MRKASKEYPFYDEKGRLIENDLIQSHLYPPLSQLGEEPVNQISVSGCGDCLAAGIIAGILNGQDEANCIAHGLKAAALSLKSFEAVPSTLSVLQLTKKQAQI